MELPESAKSKNAGATQLESYSSEVSQNRSLSQVGQTGKYTLQIASYPNREEAEAHLSRIQDLESKPFLREVDLDDKGKWYRLYLGKYPTREEAQKMGTKFHSEKSIPSFIVTTLGDEKTDEKDDSKND